MTSLDKICRSLLLRKGYSLHWYLDLILAGRDILSEMTFDDLQLVHTKKLPVGATNCFEIPAGYEDYVEVGIPVGQHVRPLVEDKSLKSLQNFDEDFNPIEYNDTADNDDDTELLFDDSFLGGLWGTSNVNQNGEQLGRRFGFGGNNCDTFKVIKERNQIQLNEALEVDFVIITFIGDGQSVDAATHIEGYAVKTIEDYMFWQLKENRRDISEGEKQRAENRHLNARQIFRARKNPLTTVTLKAIINKHTRQSIK